MPLVQLSHLKLFYVEKGEGEPLVFLNGLSGDHGSWMSQVRFFARHYRCLAVDNRDVGQSDYAAEPYAIIDLAGDVAELLELLQAGPAHVVGLSMGGMMAQELALGRPDLVKTLVQVASPGQADDWFRGTLEAFGLIRRQVPDTASFFEAILPWWVSHRFLEHAERVAWLRWLLHQDPHSQKLEGFMRHLHAIVNHDALERLPEIHCPVLLLTGEDDCVAPPRYARRLQEKIRHAQLALLSGVGHAPPIEDPGQFNSRLAEFLADQKPLLRKLA